MKLDPTALEAAVQAARVTYIANRHSMRDAVAAALATIPEPTPAESPRPIDPADVRVGDRVRAVTTWDGVITEAGDPDALYMRQDGGGHAFINPRDDETVLYLLDRPDPDAALIEAMAERAARADDDLYGGEWPAGFPGAGAYRKVARAALAALRETHNIEPRPTGGDIHA